MELRDERASPLRAGVAKRSGILSGRHLVLNFYLFLHEIQTRTTKNNVIRMSIVKASYHIITKCKREKLRCYQSVHRPSFMANRNIRENVYPADSPLIIWLDAKITGTWCQLPRLFQSHDHHHLSTTMALFWCLYMLLRWTQPSSNIRSWQSNVLYIVWDEPHPLSNTMTVRTGIPSQLLRIIKQR